MINKPAAERVAVIVTQTGLIHRGAIEVSAIAIYGGTAATGGSVTLNDSVDGTGTDLWFMSAGQYGTIPIPFSKPIVFRNGCYATLVGTGSRASIAYA